MRGIGIFRTAYFLPVVIGLGASSLLWVWMLNDRVGIINGILMDLGLMQKPLVWFVNKNLAIFAIIVSIVWKTVGFSMILLLAGMQAIPEELYDAAMVDGACYWGRLVHITHATAAPHLCPGAGALGNRLVPGLRPVLHHDQAAARRTRPSRPCTGFSITHLPITRWAMVRRCRSCCCVILAFLSIVQLRILRDETTY